MPDAPPPSPPPDGRPIDRARWSRRATHAFFLAFEDPWFNLTAEVEAGPTRRWCRAHESSFHLACWFAVLDAANAVEPFRQRLRGEEVWQWERVTLRTTALRRDGSFTHVPLPDAPDFERFAPAARTAIDAALARPGLGPPPSHDAVIFGTVVPWVRFTGIQHARAGTPGDSVPRIALGRATPEGEGVRLPVSVEVHHALVDGLHVGQFLERLEAVLAEPDRHLAGAR